MFDKEAIEALQYGGGIHEASSALIEAYTSTKVVSLPDHFTVHDLEKFMPNRRRARGSMDTSSISDFAAYVAQHHEVGAMVFVSPAMVANAVLNLGTPAQPGHADNRAQFKPRSTAAYSALLQIATGQALDQQRVAEFMEDWGHVITAFHESEPLQINKAIAAVRNITIEGLRKVEASEQQLSASRSAFEQVTASSKDTLPTFIYFKCQPYQDFDERLRNVEASSKDTLPTFIYFKCQPYQDFEFRTFVMRLGIRTSDKPAITLRIVAKEQHDEDMANELRTRVSNAITCGVPVLVGDYTAK